VNNKSYGVKKRNSQDFPSAGLRWNAVLTEGKNLIKVIAKKDNNQVSDEISQLFQIQKWSKPAKLQLKKIKQLNGIITIQATLIDDQNIFCPDAMNKIRFGITGDGSLIDNQGTSTGSSVIQLSNGSAIISVNINKGKSIVSVSSAGLPTAFLEIE
jgi:beta-galactosidase